MARNASIKEPLTPTTVVMVFVSSGSSFSHRTVELVLLGSRNNIKLVRILDTRNAHEQNAL